MLSLNSDTVIVAIKNQRSSQLDDETIIVDLDNEEYYVLNESASAIWRHLQQPVYWENLSKNANDACKDELKAFLLNLNSAGLCYFKKSDFSVTTRAINLSITDLPTLTCMGGIKELVAMAGSAGGGDGDGGDDYDADYGADDANADYGAG